MNLETLKESLKSWMCTETWHTSHPLDSKRFNNALHDAISKLGTNIHSSDLEEIITELAEEISPNMLKSNREELVTKFVIRAENILSYLSDTK